jgi:tetratricopeptide (TPR) repeat protein
MMETGPQPKSSRNLWLVAALLTAMAASLVVAFLFVVKDGNPQPGGPNGGPTNAAKTLTREESLKLLDQRDRAAALLENQEFAKADEVLSEIVRQLPDDPFGPRNLTICRELALGTIDATREAARHAEILSRAREALELLAKIEPDSHVPHVLDARLSVLANETDKAEAALKRASELAPKSAPVWYDLYTLKPAVPGEPPSADSVEALRRVHELEPDNLFVLKDWLPLQAQVKSPDLADSARRAKETLAPFADIIKTHIRVDVREMLDKLIAAVEEAKWPAATGLSMTVRNVIVSEAARDERYVKLNSLEYMLQDFGPAFYKRVDLAAPGDNARIRVSFDPTLPEQQPTFPPGVNGLVAVDLDLDGRIDAVAMHEGHAIAVMPFLPRSTDEKPITVNVDIAGNFHGLRAFDLDDDVDAKLKDRPKDVAGCQLADVDLIVFGDDGLRLFENRVTADATREFIEKPTGDPLASLKNVIDVVPMDLDLDGDLDFFTVSGDGIRLWSNRGNWSFEEITARSKLPPADFGAMSTAVCDWDKDSDLDIVVAGANGVGLLENLRHGRFRWRELDDGFAQLKQLGQRFSILIEDLDGNGSWDVIGFGPNGLKVVFTQITAGGIVTTKRTTEESTQEVNLLSLFDYNNDGYRDAVLKFYYTGATLLDGSANGGFSSTNDADHRMAEILNRATQWKTADVDGDGDEDIIVVTRDSTTWLQNNGGNANGWLDVSLLAQQIKPNEQNYSKRVNHYGIGSTIELKSGSRYQAQVVTGAVTHFGLGPQKKADVVRVLWTNGVPRNMVDPEPNLHVCEEQKLIGSCPYLYTWDGEQFTFVTDLLWNAPLGLKFAETVVAPWREWEYLKIDGGRLKAKDGEYLLKITEELWEADYHDQVKLFAIDHPAGTDIYTNEKVGPASMAEHKIHTVRSPRIPVAARDTHGRDVLDQVKSRDGIYTKTYDRKLAQGLTTEHFLELDLGPWKDRESRDDGGEPEEKERNGDQPVGDQPLASESSAALVTGHSPVVTLFLTGWVYPTSTSLNVQFSQNPDGPQPRPPALHAVDADGNWREVRPFMGFPGGKTKTIAVDISDVFAVDATDHRLRIVTNMEFYWDAAFVTVDEEPVEIRQTELRLLRADLQDRGGISFRQYDAGNGPEFFEYSRLVRGLHWPPMSGSFTRFGDVRELLTERDDKLLVLGCGDELSLAFAEPTEPLPDGWVRDFVIYNVGWDKDCDMNTVYGESVEPLPFADMTVYALRDGQPRTLDAGYEQYLQTYQTRRQARTPFWNQVRRGGSAERDWRRKKVNSTGSE